MKIAINQPTYLPWIGYFDLIDQVDLFVALDNVQFEKQSWQQRNRIKTPAGLQWLTVPVMFRGRLGQLIKDVEIRDASFVHSHLRAIELACRRAPYFAEYFPSLSTLLEQLGNGLLVDLNLGLIHWAMQVLGIGTPTIRASALGVSGKRTELLAEICSAVGGTQYVSPLGSAGYLMRERDALTQRDVEISFQNYEHPEYRQLFNSFEPYASFIDLLFNSGPDALQILRRGRRPSYSIQQISAIQTNSAETISVA